MPSLIITILIFFPSVLIAQFTTVAIIGTNDIHGTAFPALMKRSDNAEPYYYGGLPVMGGLIDIIKN